MRERIAARYGDGHGLGFAMVWAVVFVFSAFTAGTQAAELRVIPGGTSSGDCSSWAVACDLSYAWATAVPDDELWVAAGTYVPGASRDDSFVLMAGVEIYGGFDGTETMRSQRDWQANVTTLSGDIGVMGDDADNSYHVVDFSNADTTAILDGFTVTGGKTPTSWPDYHGAGIYGDGGGATLQNLVVTGNSAYYHGGGIYNDGGALVIDHTVVENNEITGTNGDGGCIHHWSGSVQVTDSEIRGCNGRLGGGFYSNNGTVTLLDVLIEGNVSANAGGGMYLSSSNNSTLTRVAFIGNTGSYGGGLSNSDVSGGPLMLTDVRFIRNVAISQGGGMNNQGAAEMVNLVFYGNSAERGGGLRNYGIGGAHTTFVSNALFVGNTATNEGGGCYNEVPDTGGVFTLLNGTFVANHSDGGGGGFNNRRGADPAAQIINSIFRGNTAAYNPQVGYTYNDVTVSYSDVEGGYAGTGNINADPMFWRLPDPGVDAVWGTEDDDYGDLHVSDVGPVVDAGDTTPVVVAMDLDGGFRVTDKIDVPDTGVGTPPVDMGAYEAGLIFHDGFESCDTSAWSDAVE